MRPSHHVYVVRCADDTFYTGYAVDPDARVRAHNAGRGARYTAGRGPVTLIYCEACPTKGAALRREHEIKRWPRARKIALVTSDAAASPPPLPRGRKRPAPPR
jgi:putative endonuclease